MGSGKSYVGKRLAAALDIDFLDLDNYIETEEKRTISDIFAQEGEVHFRNLEQKYLQKTTELDNIIIATGGGTPCFFDNINFINVSGMSIYLEITNEILAQRLAQERAHRPLIQDLEGQQLTAFIAHKVNERRGFYEQAQLIYHFRQSNQPIVQELLTYLRDIYVK